LTCYRDLEPEKGRSSAEEKELLKKYLNKKYGFVCRCPSCTGESGYLLSREWCLSRMLNKRIPLRPEICTVCLRRTKSYCKGCEKIYYCSAKCRTEDEAYHRMLCSSLKGLSGEELSRSINIFRTIYDYKVSGRKEPLNIRY
jgi:hypothetical protein